MDFYNSDLPGLVFFSDHLLILFQIFCLQLREGEEATEETNKQAVRKRRVRKDWGGDANSHCLLSPPDVEEVEGLSLLLLPHLWPEQHAIFSKLRGSLQSPLLPHPPLLQPSQIHSLPNPPVHHLLSFLPSRDWSCWGFFCAFSCCSCSILSFHTFCFLRIFFAKRFLSQRLSDKKAVCSFDPPTHLFSLKIHQSHLRASAAFAAFTSSCSYCLTAYHRGLVWEIVLRVFLGSFTESLPYWFVLSNE